MPTAASENQLRYYGEIESFFDEFASTSDAWRRKNRGYHELVENVYRFHVPPGRSVLEIGCGTGDLLAALEPAHGVGVDLSGAMIDEAAARAIRTCGSSRRRARTSTSTRRSTSSSSRTSCRTFTISSRCSTAFAHIAGPTRA